LVPLNAQAEAAVGRVLEFDAFLAPDKLDRAHGGEARFCIALLKFVNRALAAANAKRSIGFAEALERRTSTGIPEPLDRITNRKPPAVSRRGSHLRSG
jgi:hypothetical protein